MRIGVDIDGVLTYRTQILWAIGAKYCAEHGLKCEINPEKVGIRGMFGVDDEAHDEIWTEYGSKWTIGTPAQMFASEVIRKLREEGHEIWIITGRSETDPRTDGMLEGEGWEETTKRWLEKEGIVYDRIAFGQHDKGKFCRENEVEVMIEDDPGYLETFDGQTRKVVIFDQPYNQKVVMENGARVRTWYEFYELVRKEKK